MNAPSIDRLDVCHANTHVLDRLRAHALERVLRRRLTVVGWSTVDVVRYAGGWIFDQAAAGWDVTVVVSDLEDSRPLEVLGATGVDFETCLASPRHDVWPDAVAVEMNVYTRDGRIRDGIRALKGRGDAEVTFWGDDLTSGDTVDRQLSFAARAFKAHALAAAQEPAESVRPVETFHVGLGNGADLRVPGLVSLPWRPSISTMQEW